MIMNYKKTDKEYLIYDAADPKAEPVKVEKGTLILKASDFGILGDGVADDGPAIEKLCAAAVETGEAPCVIQFEKNHVYRIKSVADVEKCPYVFNLSNGKNIIVDGGDSTFLLTMPIRPMRVYYSDSITLTSMIIDYDPSPFALGRVTEINVEGGYILFETETDMNLGEEGYFDCPPIYFAHQNTKLTRDFLTFTRIEDAGTGKYHYKGYVLDVETVKVHVAYSGTEWIFPVAHVAHYGNPCESYAIFYSGNINFVNFRIYSNPYFNFSVSGNYGEIRFINFALERPKDSRVQALVSWRDAFHVKENILPITWDRCRIMNSGDDAFNICSSIKGINELKRENGKIYLKLQSVGGYAADILKVGDKFDAYNVQNGRFYGQGEIKEILRHEFPYTDIVIDDIPSLEAEDGARIGFDSTASPGSIIKDCYVEGTARFKGNLTVKNTTFDLLQMWIMMELDIEGPIAKNILFEDCTFKNGRIILDSFNWSIPNSAFPEIGEQIKNIVFRRCKFEGSARVECFNGTQAIFED